MLFRGAAQLGPALLTELDALWVFMPTVRAGAGGFFLFFGLLLRLLLRFGRVQLRLNGSDVALDQPQLIRLRPGVRVLLISLPADFG